MNILGINAYHPGAAACLIRDGVVVAAAEEERFNRRKYWAGFPVHAIRFVLDEARITAHDLGHVGISRDPHANLLRKGLFALARRPSLDLIRRRLANASEVRDVRRALATALGLEPGTLRADFHNIGTTARTSRAPSLSRRSARRRFSRSTAWANFVSTMWGVGRDASIESEATVNFPHSLGFFYIRPHQWLGFQKYWDEGKTMGSRPMAADLPGQDAGDRPYPARTAPSAGSRLLRRPYRGHTMSWEGGDAVLGRLYSSRLVDLLGDPRPPGGEITQYHENVAASAQAILEEAELALVRASKQNRDEIALPWRAAWRSTARSMARSFQYGVRGIYISAGPIRGKRLSAPASTSGSDLGQPRAWVMNHA